MDRPHSQHHTESMAGPLPTHPHPCPPLLAPPVSTSISTICTAAAVSYAVSRAPNAPSWIVRHCFWIPLPCPPPLFPTYKRHWRTTTTCVSEYIQALQQRIERYFKACRLRISIRVGGRVVVFECLEEVCGDPCDG